MLSTWRVRTDFVSIRVVQLHPDLDCVFVNSGIQRRSVFSEPNAITMADISEEMTVITIPLRLSTVSLIVFLGKLHFLPCVNQRVSAVLLGEEHPNLIHIVSSRHL